MMLYFDLFLEFNHDCVDNTILDCIIRKKKGYVCVVDGNVLAYATKDNPYKKIINEGLINICDGSSIALLAGKIYNKKFKTYTGPDLFACYIKKELKQLFLGNTEQNLNLLKTRFEDLKYPTKLS